LPEDDAVQKGRFYQVFSASIPKKQAIFELSDKLSISAKKPRKRAHFGKKERTQERTPPQISSGFSPCSKIVPREPAPDFAVGRNFAREVQPMIPSKERRKILEKYPEYITKEQMYQICHISKRTCLFLLESGLVPNENNGKKTHCYKIKTVDVMNYLQAREEHPERYKAPNGFYKSGKAFSTDEICTEENLAAMRQYYEDHLSGYPEVLTLEQIAQFTGYSLSSVRGWCSRQRMRYFCIRNRFFVPKEYLLDFLLSRSFIGIAAKSAKHRKMIEQIKTCQTQGTHNHY